MRLLYMKKWILPGLLLIIILIIVLVTFISPVISTDIELLKDNNAIIDIFLKQKLIDLKMKSPFQWVPLEGIPIHLQKAVLASEDTRFFSHNGIDFREMFRSLKKNYRRKKIHRGGSTITMQIAKNLFLNSKKNYYRKIKEILITIKIEQALTKKRILEIYFNIIEFGENIIGIESAAQYYFNKRTIDLNKYESVKLSIIIPNPKKIKIDSKYVYNRISFITNEMRHIKIK